MTDVDCLISDYSDALQDAGACLEALAALAGTKSAAYIALAESYVLYNGQEREELQKAIAKLSGKANPAYKALIDAFALHQAAANRIKQQLESMGFTETEILLKGCELLENED